MKPYNTALPIYRVLTKLHATANLLRAFTWFLYLVRQLSGVQQQIVQLAVNNRSNSPSMAGDRSRSSTPSFGQSHLAHQQQAKPQSSPANAAESSRLTVRAAKTYAEMTRHLASFPKLRSLRAVNEIEAAVKASREFGAAPLR